MTYMRQYRVRWTYSNLSRAERFNDAAWFEANPDRTYYCRPAGDLEETELNGGRTPHAYLCRAFVTVKRGGLRLLDYAPCLEDWDMIFPVVDEACHLLWTTDKRQFRWIAPGIFIIEGVPEPSPVPDGTV